MERKLDIIVCTLDREEQLVDCIQSLSNQVEVKGNWGLIVVNNDNQPLGERVTHHINRINNSRIVNESIPGLSRARNKGTSISEAEWIGFLDDDAKVPGSFIARAQDIINNENFDCFGGHIRSWWKYGRRRWLVDGFGSKPILQEKRGVLEEGYNWGSNIFVRRQALVDVGCFPVDIGLKGKHLGYAAENLVQIDLREKGYMIGYDPDLIIDHAVLPHKLKLWWHIRSAFATGRDGRRVFPDQYGFFGILSSIKNCFTRPLKAILNWATKNDFYWENVFLEFGKPIAILFGKISSFFR